MPPDVHDQNILPLEEQHPFMNPLTDELLGLVPSDELKTLRSWTAQQSNYPKLTDNHLRLFLHSNYGDQLQTQKTLEGYLKIRSKHPELFANRNTKIQEIQQVLDISEMSFLPTVTSKGYQILIYRLKDINASKFDFVNGVKTFMLVNDVFLSEAPLCPGFVVIFDMAGVCLSHLTRINFSALRVFMKYIQDCHPARLKAIYVINTVSFIDRILCLIKPFIKSELLNLINFFGPVSSLEKHIPLELFPEDYGGKASKMSTLHAQTRNWCEEKYHTWLLEEEKLRLNAGNKIVKEIDCSFKQLVLD